MRAIVIGWLFLCLAGCATTSNERPVFNSKAADLNAQLGDGYAQQGRYPRAVEKYTKAIAFNPKLERAYLGAVQVASLTGDRALAAKFLDKFVAALPEQSTAYESYAAFYCRAGEFLAAEKQLLAALEAEVYSEKAEVYNKMTACAREVSRFDLAAVYNDYALQQAPDNPSVLLQSALNDYAQKQPAKALLGFEKYYANGGVEAQWLQLAAELAKVAGVSAEAQQWQQRIKTLYPLMKAQ